MPELHPTAAGTAPAMLEAAAYWTADTDDYALGCECADPALQIERWGVDDPEGRQPG